MIHSHRLTNWLLVILMVAMMAPMALAQTEPSAPDPTRYLIQTNDGNVYRGIIVKKEVESIQLQTENIGVITIQFDDIRKIERLSGDYQPSSYYQSPDDPEYQQRLEAEKSAAPLTYFIRPSAFGLKKGEAYYQNFWLVFNEINIGISDYFSVGMGLMPVPIDGDGMPVWINPRLNIPIVKDKIYWGISTVNGMTLSSNNFGFGIVHSDITLGSASNHFSVGLGKAYDHGGWFNEAVFTFSGSLRVGNDFHIVTEDYVMKHYSYYSVGCYQHLSEKVVLNWGLMFFSDNLDTYPVPLLGITVPLEFDF